MTPRWMKDLVRARETQRDQARQRVTFAGRAVTRAEQDELATLSQLIQARTRVDDARAVSASQFVAAAHSSQRVAEAYGLARAETERAGQWLADKKVDLTESMRAQHIAERLLADAEATAARERARREQLAIDESATIGHQRRRIADGGEHA